MVEGDDISNRGEFLLKTGPFRFEALADGANQIDQIDRQHLHAEAFEQLGLVDDGGPEEVDALSDLADAHRLHGLDHAGGADEAINAFLERWIVDAAVLDVGEGDARGCS